METRNLRSTVWAGAVSKGSALAAGSYAIWNSAIMIPGSAIRSQAFSKRIWKIMMTITGFPTAGTPATLTVSPHFQFTIKINNAGIPIQNIITDIGGAAFAEDALCYEMWRPDFPAGTTNGFNTFVERTLESSNGPLCTLGPSDILYFVIQGDNNDPANSWNDPRVNLAVTIYWEQLGISGEEINRSYGKN